MVESLGSTVRLGWTGVAGATQYRILILNREGKHLSSMYSSLPLLTSINTNLLLIILMKVCVFVCVMPCQWLERKYNLSLATRQRST